MFALMNEKQESKQKKKSSKQFIKYSCGKGKHENLIKIILCNKYLNLG
jgi:hypothetical protein